MGTIFHEGLLVTLNVLIAFSLQSGPDMTTYGVIELSGPLSKQQNVDISIIFPVMSETKHQT